MECQILVAHQDNGMPLYYWRMKKASGWPPWQSGTEKTITELIKRGAVTLEWRPGNLIK